MDTCTYIYIDTMHLWKYDPVSFYSRQAFSPQQALLYGSVNLVDWPALSKLVVFLRLLCPQRGAHTIITAHYLCNYKFQVFVNTQEMGAKMQ